MNTYTASDHPCKAKARNKLINVIKASKISIFNCLSMPNSNFYWEKMMLEQFNNLQIDTVENNIYTYNKGRAIAKQLNISHKNRDIFKYLASSNKKYNLIWLDMCGYLSPSLINNLIPIVQGNYTTNEAILALTIQRSREQLNPEFYGCSSKEELRVKGLYKLLKQYAKFNNVKLSLINVHKYVTKSPMQLLTFKLIKL